MDRNAGGKASSRLEIRGIEAFDETGRRLGYVDHLMIDSEGSTTIRVRDDDGDVAVWRPANLKCDPPGTSKKIHHGAHGVHGGKR